MSYGDSKYYNYFTGHNGNSDTNDKLTAVMNVIVIITTGASRGLGAGIAQQFAVCTG